jgi:hypothetical protein
MSDTLPNIIKNFSYDFNKNLTVKFNTKIFSKKKTNPSYLFEWPRILTGCHPVHGVSTQNR